MSKPVPGKRGRKRLHPLPNEVVPDKGVKDNKISLQAPISAKTNIDMMAQSYTGLGGVSSPNILNKTHNDHLIGLGHDGTDLQNMLPNF